MIAKDLGPRMSHFKSGCEAIVIGSYAELCGGNGCEQYKLHIKGSGPHAWYEARQLTMIGRCAHDLLGQWVLDEKELEAKQSDIDWIFDNGVSVAENPSGASCAALFACLSDASMWGTQGEGVIWHQNAMTVMRLATPYLRAGKKQEWLDACASYREAVRNV